ncbi:MAG: DMT family transporter, partial [Candidatus Micrarchaeota archaeon]|nr:DMT family transporter [Candidatus Micrarchaeota archaeon]
MRPYFIGLGLIIGFGAYLATYYLGSIGGGSCSPIDSVLGFATGACNNLILGTFTPLELIAFAIGVIFVAIGLLLPAANVRMIKEIHVIEKHEGHVDDSKRAVDGAGYDKDDEVPDERDASERGYKSKDYAVEGSTVHGDNAAGADSTGQHTERYAYTTDGKRKKIDKNAQKKDSGIGVEDIKGISHHKSRDGGSAGKDDSKEVKNDKDAATNCPQCGSP